MELYDFNPSCVGKRSDIRNLLPTNAEKIFDVGRSAGALGEQLKLEKKADITGIELLPRK